jgi:ATP phosphoribosyltransferase
MSSSITIASAKGYLLSESIASFEKIGISFGTNIEDSRKLFTKDTTGKYKLLKIRPWDVPEYVENGAADLGIVGLDVIEEKKSNVIRLLDLKFGVCKLVIAGPTHKQPMPLHHHISVATKFPSLTADYFEKKNIKAKLIKLYGAIELAPLTGLSDIISDLTATGTTLKEHKLDIMDTVLESSAYLIANPSSYRTHYDTIVTLVNQLQRTQ